MSTDPTGPGGSEGAHADADGPIVRRLADGEAVAAATAAHIADGLTRAVAARGTASLALSGGSTPLSMVRVLATADLDWSAVHVLQVDERFAPDGDPHRNWTAIDAHLIGPTGATGHPMPAGAAVHEDVADAYAAVLAEVAGGVIDVVHLGLGGDGHTASLVPGDAVLRIEGADVAITDAYQGLRRMTLTAPAINRARWIVWQVVGAGKAPAVAQLLQGDPAIPGALVRRTPDVWLLADEAALGPAGLASSGA